MNISYTGNTMRISGIEFDPHLTLMDSAQVFHWEKNEDTFFGCAGGHTARLISTEDGFLLKGIEEDEVLFWKEYFDLDRNYNEVFEACADYPIAKKAMLLLPGLRVLNQPVWETLLTFILSANNNVSRIRQLVKKLISLTGETGCFPLPEQLAAVSEAELRAMGCGYRAPYLIRTARMVRDGFPLEGLRSMKYDEAHRMLISLPGVGDKVADCVQLFGLGHSEAFPVDVWVERLMKNWFMPDVRTKKEICVRAREMFGRHAGLIQQSLFHCARLGLIEMDTGV